MANKQIVVRVNLTPETAKIVSEQFYKDMATAWLNKQGLSDEETDYVIKQFGKEHKNEKET